MLETVPSSISIVFLLICIATFFLFHLTLKNSRNEKVKSQTVIILIGLFAWLILQSALSYNGFYLNTKLFPPKFIFVIAPPFLLIIFLFISKTGRNFIDSLPLATITYTNVVRIPVELVLYLLFINHTIPQLMTFEGRNFDILAGLTAPLILYFGFVKNIFNRKIILAWNIIALCLLLNIVANAILSAPFPFQQFGFEQPNIALLYFPFTLLPAFVVPVILFGHLVSIRQLMLKQK